MRYLALLALWAIPAGAAAPMSALPLQALTEADLGANALENSACYVHEGPAVLLVASNRNAVVNWDGDLIMLKRVGGGAPDAGAQFAGNRFRLHVSTTQSGARTARGRIDRPAHIRVVRKGVESRMAARWSCAA